MTSDMEDKWTRRIKNLGFPIVVASIALYGGWSIGNRLIDEHIKFLSKVSASTEIQSASQVQMSATLASLQLIQQDQIAIDRQILESQKDTQEAMVRGADEQADTNELQRQMNDLQRQMIEILKDSHDRIKQFSPQ